MRGHVGKSRCVALNNDFQKYYYTEYQFGANLFFMDGSTFLLATNKVAKNPSSVCKLIHFKSLLNNFQDFFSS